MTQGAQATQKSSEETPKDEVKVANKTTTGGYHPGAAGYPGCA